MKSSTFRCAVVAMLLVLVTMLGVPAAFADEPAGALQPAEAVDALTAQTDDIASGTWGTCPWEISADGKLTVHSGVGADAEEYTSPWADYANDITSVVFEADGDGKVVAPANSGYLFRGLFKATAMDLSGLDTSAATSMHGMFLNCSSLAELDASGFVTSNVTSMAGMFNGCAKLTSINLTGIDTSEVTNINSIFFGCTSLTSLDLSSFDTSKLKNADAMFSGCTSLETIEVGSGWSIGDTTYSKAMFYNCTSLVGGNGTKYDRQHVAGDYARIDAEGAPGYLTASATVPLASGTWGTCPWEISAKGVLTVRPGTGEDTEGKCPWTRYKDSVTSVVFAAEGGEKVVAPANCSGLLSGLAQATSIDLSGLETSGTTNMQTMFAGCGLEGVDLSPLDTSQVANMHGLFVGCPNLKAADLSVIDTSKVTSFARLFDSCPKLATANLSGMKTGANASLHWMFYGCESLTAVDFSGADTSGVTSVSCMFELCTSLKELDLTALDTSSVTDMGGMFFECTSLEVLDLSSFDTSHVTRMRNSAESAGMFARCPALRTIYVGGKWSTASLDLSDTSYSSGSKSLFAGCTSLVGGNGTKYDEAHVGAEYARIDAEDTPGYLTEAVSKETVFRLYDTHTGEHHYTKDANERDVLLSWGNWNDEGTAWVTPSKSSTPVYRVYDLWTGEHHYTSDKHEQEVLVGSGRWRDEGIAWYSDDAKTVKVFRIERHDLGPLQHHHYTVNERERNICITEWNWNDEGIGWYALAAK